MAIGRGKIAEALKYQNAFTSECISVSAATVYYNGNAITDNSGIMIDTQDFDEINFVINPGTVLGTLATIQNTVYDSATDDPTAAALVTGASFTDVNSSNDDAIQEGSILCKNAKRYMCLRTEVLGTLITIDFSAIAALGKVDGEAVSKTLTFDVI